MDCSEDLLKMLADADVHDPAAYLEIARCAAKAIDEKDNYTSGHSERVATYSVVLGRHLGLGERDLYRLRLAALLHDIGKLGVRSLLLNKQGRLTPAERSEMRAHARRGGDFIRATANLTEILPGIELHHESWDGSGYPYGLHRTAIPLMARIIAVADTYDAVTSQRPYQAPMTEEEACELIQSLAGTRFCPETVQAFIAAYRTNMLALRKPARTATTPEAPSLAEMQFAVS